MALCFGRAHMNGEVANQDVHFPGIIPKLPGRFYYYFGKPFETEGTLTRKNCILLICCAWLTSDINFNCYIYKGRKEELRNREKAHELYLQVKGEVENCLAYLTNKRESDPYRQLWPRLAYQAKHGFTAEVPTFEI